MRAGGTLQSPAGLLAIDSVEAVADDEVTDEDVRAAGYLDRTDAMADLRPEGTLYRIRFHRAGDDPRVALRQRSDLTEGEVEEVARSLARAPWALPILRLIAERPGTVSTELATELGMERQRLKQRVRRLKDAGLTESLRVGYRLSPRGRAVLDRLD